MADELEILTAQFDADISRFSKKIDQMLGDFNRNSSGIEQRNAQTIAKLNQQFGQISFTKLLGAVGVTAVLDRMVESSKELADKTLNLASTTGFAAENIQGLGILARKAGVDQDSLTTAIEHFSAQVGEAQLRQTDFGKAMAALGVNIKDGPQAALLEFADKIGELPKAQQAAIAQMAFGRGGVANLAWLTEGSKNIKDMIAGFQQMGLVVPTDKLKQIQEVFDAWQDIKTEALTGFIDGFSGFAGDISSQAFQSGVHEFGVAMGEVSGFIVKMAPYLPLLIETIGALKGAETGAALGGRLGAVFGPEGAAIGGAAGLLIGGVAGGAGSQYLLNKLRGTPGGVAPGSAAAAGAPTKDLSGLLDADQAAKSAARLAELNKQLDAQIQETITKSFGSYADLVKAQNEALIETAKGTAAYYDVQKKAIEQNSALDIENINAAKDAAIQAIFERRDAQLASLKTMKLSQEQYAAEVKKIDEASKKEEVNIAVDASDKVSAANVKRIQELIQADWQYQESLQSLVQVTSTIRDGLTNVGLAGLHGFKSLKDAAAQFLDQLAQVAFKLYAIQPLLNGLLGPAGTSGGGLFGGLLGSIFGSSLADNAAASIIANPLLFAEGGVYVPGRGRQALKRFAGGGVSGDMAIFGDAGPEAAVPLPDGRSIPVTLRIPQAVGRSNAPPMIYQQIDLSGAVVTDELYARMERTADSRAQLQIANYDRHAIPQRVRTLTKDPRRSY